MRLLVIPLLTLYTLAAGQTQFGDPAKTVSKYAGDQAVFAFTVDPTNGTGGAVVAEPFKTATIIINVDTTKFTAIPTVSTSVPGASVTPFAVTGGYKFIIVGGGDITPSGELFQASFTCPTTPGTYTFTVASVTLTNAAGTPVAMQLPVASPDTIIVKAKPLPWLGIFRFFK